MSALGGQETYFRTAFEHAAIGMALLDPDGRWLQVNPSFCQTIGRSEAELRKLTFQDITHPDDLAVDLEHVRRLLAGEIPSYVLEKRYLRPDGQCVWAQLTAALVRDSAGAPLHFIAQIQDITDRKQAQAALQQSNARFEGIAANAPGMVYQYVYRPDGTSGYTYVSEGARTLFGVAPEAALQDPSALLGLIHPDERALFLARAREVAQSLGPFQWAGRVVLGSGEERVIHVVARDYRQPDGTVVSDGLVTDVTEQRALQEQLRQAQKLEAVGRLAGGIAHDFNNLLAAILANAELALAELPDGPVRHDVDVIRQAAERAAGLTRQLLAFSRKQVITPRLVDLNAVVRQTMAMLRRTLSESIAVEPHLEAVGSALCDPGQLEQVLVNLAVNAADAMPEGGTLTLRTRDVVADESLARRHKGLRPGTYVTLAVEDTGIGMDAATQARIFEPFFTTKAVGKGTGLGLATVYGLVKQWGGYVAVESAVDVGSTFTVYLPRHEGAPSAHHNAAPHLPTGTETVLIVEDETAVRNSTRRILTRQGYTVLEARHGTDALRVLDQAPRPVDLVVTDLIMPEMGGRQLIAELGGRISAPKILVISGYDQSGTLKGEALPAGTRFLAKPFTVAGLLQSVRAALDGGNAATPQATQNT